MFYPQFPLNNAICPIEFENHMYAGIAKVEKFTHIEFGDIRTTFINGRPYFCAIDIMNALGISSVNLASKYIDDAVQDILAGTFDMISDDDNLDTPYMPYRGCNYGMIPPNELYFTVNIEVSHYTHNVGMTSQIVATKFISKPILYCFIFRSNKQSARRFKGWLAGFVLPYLEYLGIQNSMSILQNSVEEQNKDMLNKIYDTVSDTNNIVKDTHRIASHHDPKNFDSILEIHNRGINLPI